MNSMSRVLAALAGCLVFAVATANDVTAFVNVNVIPMSSETVLEQQTVIVADGKIQVVAHVDDVPVPEGAMLIDGTDRFLMPGLAEMHAHVTGTEPRQIDRLATLFVANGVTRIRGMLGQPSHLELRAQFERGDVFGPRLVTSGPSFNGRSVSSPAQAAQMVRDQHAAGYDFLKVHPGLTRKEFTMLAATANEIGMPFAGHVPAASGVADALRNRMATIDHLDGYFPALLPPDRHVAGGNAGFFDVMLADDIDVRRIPQLAADTAAAGTWNVPTEVLVEQIINATPVSELRQRPEMRYVPRSQLQRWVDAKQARQGERSFNAETAARAIELRRRLILELHNAGAGLLLGSDAPQIFNVPGFSVHRELKALVAAGLSPYQALRTGTVAVADFLGTNTGAVAAGRDADLILLDANPLADIGNSDRIHGVMLRGRWLSSRELAARLSQFEVDERPIATKLH